MSIALLPKTEEFKRVTYFVSTMISNETSYFIKMHGIPHLKMFKKKENPNWMHIFCKTKLQIPPKENYISLEGKLQFLSPVVFTSQQHY